MSPDFHSSTLYDTKPSLPDTAAPPPDLMQFAAEDIRAMVQEVLG